MDRIYRLTLLTMILCATLLGGCSDDDDDSPTAPAVAGPQLVISGSFILDTILAEINGYPASGAFDHLAGHVIQVELKCDSLASISQIDGYSGPSTVITTGPGELVFSGDPLGFLDVAATDNFQDEDQTITLSVDEGDADDGELSTNLVGAAGEQYFGLEFSVDYLCETDTGGYPELQDIGTRMTQVTLRRYSNTGSHLMTDLARGSMSITVEGMTDVPVVVD